MRRFDEPGRSPVHAENGMAATSHPLATMSALSVLKAGGNAVDAAIAAAATLCVVEPHMTGIGGDCFVILAEPDGSIHGLNGSGRAPRRADPERLRAMGMTEMPEVGPHSITVPGALKAWEMLLYRFGTRGIEVLLRDAIQYAEDGFAIQPRVAHDWPRFVADLREDEGGLQHCLMAGEAPRLGQRFCFPALARTLRTISDGGVRAFYGGPIAREIAATVQAKGGVLDEEDMADAAADWVTPISTHYRGVDLLEIPPNGQGVTALILLNVLDRIGVDHSDPSSVARCHGLIEAARLAYSVRDHLVSDPATMTVSPEHLISGGFADQLASRFSSSRRNDDVSMPDMPRASTVYLTVVDRDRRAVSFINSLYGGFGSKVVTPVSGVVLQNRGACFNLIPGHPNEYGPAKRPMHTIIPAMALKNGRPFAAYGVMGGAYQPMGHAHVLSNMVDCGMNAQEAVDHARLFWDEEGTLTAEKGVPSETRHGLEALGHRVRDADRPHGGGQIIVIDEENGFLVGASDPRKDGLALGW